MKRTERMIEILTLGVVVLTIVLLVSSLTGAASPTSNGSIAYVDTDKLQDKLPDFQKLDALIKDKKSELDSYQGYLYQLHRNSIKQMQDKATQDKNGKSAADQEAIDKKLQ